MRLFPEELALANLKGEITEDERGFMPRDEAYEWLKELSGQLKGSLTPFRAPRGPFSKGSQ